MAAIKAEWMRRTITISKSGSNTNYGTTGKRIAEDIASVLGLTLKSTTTDSASSYDALYYFRDDSILLRIYSNVYSSYYGIKWELRRKNGEASWISYYTPSNTDFAITFDPANDSTVAYSILNINDNFYIVKQTPQGSGNHGFFCGIILDSNGDEIVTAGLCDPTLNQVHYNPNNTVTAYGGLHPSTPSYRFPYVNEEYNWEYFYWTTKPAASEQFINGKIYEYPARLVRSDSAVTYGVLGGVDQWYRLLVHWNGSNYFVSSGMHPMANYKIGEHEFMPIFSPFGDLMII